MTAMFVHGSKAVESVGEEKRNGVVNNWTPDVFFLWVYPGGVQRAWSFPRRVRH